jgi:hypothetical protein
VLTLTLPQPCLQAALARFLRATQHCLGASSGDNSSSGASSGGASSSGSGGGSWASLEDLSQLAWAAAVVFEGRPPPAAYAWIDALAGATAGHCQQLQHHRSQHAHHHPQHHPHQEQQHQQPAQQQQAAAWQRQQSEVAHSAALLVWSLAQLRGPSVAALAPQLPAATQQLLPHLDPQAGVLLLQGMAKLAAPCDRRRRRQQQPGTAAGLPTAAPSKPGSAPGAPASAPFGKSRLLPDGAWLAAAAAATASALGRQRAQGLATLIWSWGRLGHHPGRAWLHAWHACATQVLPSFSTQQLAAAAWGLAAVGEWHCGEGGGGGGGGGSAMEAAWQAPCAAILLQWELRSAEAGKADVATMAQVLQGTVQPRRPV